MRKTIFIDETLIEQARAMTGIHETSALVREGLKALISSAAAKRLAAMGGTQQGLQDVPRRRSAV